MKNGFCSVGVSLAYFVAGEMASADPVPDEAIVLWRDADRLGSQGRKDEAFRTWEECLKVLNSGDYSGTPEYRDLMIRGAELKHTLGDPKGAIALAERVIEVVEGNEDELPHPMGQAHLVIAQCLATMDELEASEKAAQTGLEILGKVPYKDPAVPNLIPRCHSIRKLGAAHHGLGDFLLAEKYYRLAVADAERLMGFPPQDVSYDVGKFIAAQKACASLGGFYAMVGDHERAIPVLIRGLEIKKKIGPSFQNGSETMGDTTFVSLSRAYAGVGDLIQAEHYSRSGIQQATMNNDLRTQATATSTLASVMDSKGDYAEAAKLIAQIQEIQRTMMRNPSFENPALVNNLGWLALKSGKLEAARDHLTRAFSIARDQGEEHSELAANILYSLSMVEFLEGKPDRGVIGLRKGSLIYEKELERLVGFGSDSQKLAFLKTLRGKTDAVAGLCFERYPEHPELAEEALLTVFRRKNRMTQLSRQSAVLSRSLAPSHEARMNLEQERSRLGLLSLSLGVVDRDRASELGRDWMVKLEEAERRVREAAQRPVRPESSNADIDSVAGSLRDDEILIEYVVYRTFDLTVPNARKSELPLRCGAFVLDSNGTIRVIDLGGYDEIQRESVTFRRALSNRGDSTFEKSGRALYQKLIQPVLAAAPDKKRLRIAPDGQLHLIPYEALIDDDGSYLTERFSISYLMTGGELPGLSDGKFQGGKVTVIANPDYDMQVGSGGAGKLTDESTLTEVLGKVSELGAPLQFPPLPGTATEATKISEVMPGSTVIHKSDATELQFRKLAKSGVVHVATHGFYLNDDLIASTGQRGLKRVEPVIPVGLENAKEDLDTESWIGDRSIDHPLMNCGLVFSGANRLWDGENDGILTGLEVLGMDLSKTELVVLSACETGVGEVVTGEGVLGLGQAFRVAGASSMVMSLWKVDDEATAELMTEFYTALSKGASKGDALRQASAKLRKSDRWNHPAYWAAFLLSGDDGPLAK